MIQNEEPLPRFLIVLFADGRRSLVLAGKIKFRIIDDDGNNSVGIDNGDRVKAEKNLISDMAQVILATEMAQILVEWYWNWGFGNEWGMWELRNDVNKQRRSCADAHWRRRSNNTVWVKKEELNRMHTTKAHQRRRSSVDACLRRSSVYARHRKRSNTIWIKKQEDEQDATQWEDKRTSVWVKRENHNSKQHLSPPTSTNAKVAHLDTKRRELPHS
ncbi:hypothetical protein VNO78_03636 [Psophocarpus tetragonolobus]|uniref:Uncharacterized protein n=1 Tax=Psophocarpus tetragonolobus TaxID=3891 RepID=A0AAN9XW40_PSOTE